MRYKAFFEYVFIWGNPNSGFISRLDRYSALFDSLEQNSMNIFMHFGADR